MNHLGWGAFFLKMHFRNEDFGWLQGKGGHSSIKQQILLSCEQRLEFKAIKATET